MANSKVVLGSEVLIDLTSDTVETAADIAEGKYGHLKDGTRVCGTHRGGSDATATAADILSGKTAYVASGKVTGSYVPVLEFANVSVPVSAWIADSTYFGYSYRAAVTCNGATSAMFPYVEFSNNDVDDGYFAIYAESYTNGVYIYSEIIPDSVITIAKIRFFKEA